MMDVRVDLEHLKHLSKRVQDLENEARRLRILYGEMLVKCQELKNTLQGLSAEYGFSIDLTPTETPPPNLIIVSENPRILERDVSVAIKNIQQESYVSDEEATTLLEELGVRIKK